MTKNYNLITFEGGGVRLDVRVSEENNSVWLNRKQLALLYEKDIKTIGKHVNNILKNRSVVAPVVAKIATTAEDGKLYGVEYYNLNVILDVGNRVKSNRTELFKNWAENLSNIQNSKIALVEPIIRFETDDICLDVKVSPNEDTVWLTQQQISDLFDSSKSNINEHINHIIEEKELDFNSVVRNFRTTGLDGKVYDILHYNLDMIMSVGYRVNSKRGIMFRHWVTNVLKQYLLKGSVINEQRCLSCTSNILNLQDNYRKLEEKINNLEDKINLDEERILYEGEILDAYTFIRKLFFTAKEEIIIIDPYADKFLLSMLTDLKVNITIITRTDSYINKYETSNYKIVYEDNIHDRYIIIDNDVYAFGTSFNEIGKKRTVMIKLRRITKEMILPK